MIPSLTSFGEFSLNFRYGHLLAKFTVCEPSDHLVVLCRDQSTYTDSQLMQNLYIMVYCIFKRLVDCRFLQASFRAMRQTFLLWLVLTILNFFNMAVRYNHTGTQFFEIKKWRPLTGYCYQCLCPFWIMINLIPKWLAVRSKNGMENSELGHMPFSSLIFQIWQPIFWDYNIY